MDFVKQYIIQAIVVAANNLRLNSEKIESVAIIREHLNTCENIIEEIKRFKKITELSKLGIKLGELHSKVHSDKINFLNISNDFKEQSHSLVIVLSNFLDTVSPIALRKILYSSHEEPLAETIKNEQPEIVEEKESIKIEVMQEKKKSAIEVEGEELKKEIIFDELKKVDENELSFEEFQRKVLKPIKSLEALLLRMSNLKYDNDELRSYIDVIKKNAELSDKNGFTVIANMHVIFAVGLKLISNQKLLPDRNIIESLRACLIVIVAIVKRKEVDITSYLNKAEKFGEQIVKYK